MERSAASFPLSSADQVTKPSQNKTEAASKLAQCSLLIAASIKLKLISTATLCHRLVLATENGLLCTCTLRHLISGR
jgi:hypothetical protein